MKPTLPRPAFLLPLTLGWALVGGTALARGGHSGSDAARPHRGGHSASHAAHDLGTITVDNDRGHPVAVYIDRGFAGEVVPDGRRSFTVQAGRHEIEVRSSRGQVIERRIETVHPGDVDLVQIEALMGSLRVDNLTGAPMRISLDGRSHGTLAPGQSRLIQAEAGTHDLRVTYSQLGSTRVLLDEDVRLHPRRDAAVALRPPATGLVAVVNPLDRSVDLLIDGRYHGRLAPHQRTEVAVPLGRTELALRLDGRIVAAERRTVAPFEDEVFAPRVVLQGRLLVDNDTRRDLQVYIDGRFHAWLEADRTLSLVVDAGSHTVEARTSSGREVLDRTVHVSPDETERLEVEYRRGHGHGHGHGRYGAVYERPAWSFGYADRFLSFTIQGDALSDAWED